MLLHCGVRSVSKLACYLGVSMFQTLEEPVIASLGLKHITSTSMNECVITTNVEEEYEKTIKALNTLQSNADTVRRSIANKTKQTPLQDTVKYLNRSGLSVEDLKKLSVIHVSGTKGKGSTCALTESILRNHGVKTGFFSSPHLVSVTERIRINGQPIGKQKFSQAFWRIFKRLEKYRQHDTDMPPYFKFLTILCFHIFLEEKVDVTVLEVGIGGELDCTNVASHTKTVGITSLGLEHTNLLGDTLEDIAWQKAGIIKNNSNVYTSATQSECLRVIKERAAEKNATLYIVPEFSQYMLNGKSCPQLQNLNNVIQLNGSLAIQLAYDWLRNNKNEYRTSIAPNTPVITEKVIEGITNCSWPGRCQIMDFDNFKIHLDGAHTLESICLCSNWFNNVTKNSPNPKVLIFNATGERDSRRLLELLRQKTDITLACFVPNIASGSSNNSDNMSVFGIADQMKRAKLHASNWQLLCYESGESDNGQVFGSILDSLCFVRQQFGQAQNVDVLVTGSLHLIGATMLALDLFKRRTEQTKTLDVRVED